MPSPKCNKLSQAAGLSHILDPAYSSYSNRSQDLSSRTAYMDCGGQLHDPDYRHFELPGVHSHLHSYTKPKSNEHRFAWELEAAALSGDEDEEDLTPPRRRSFSSEYYSSSAHSSPAWPASPTLFEEDYDGSYSDNDRDLPREVIPSSPPPPRGDSPTLAIRKHFLALELRVRFKAYRVKKRLSKT